MKKSTVIHVCIAAALAVGIAAFGLKKSHDESAESSLAAQGRVQKAEAGARAAIQVFQTLVSQNPMDPEAFKTDGGAGRVVELLTAPGSGDLYKKINGSSFSDVYGNTFTLHALCSSLFVEINGKAWVNKSTP